MRVRVPFARRRHRNAAPLRAPGAALVGRPLRKRVHGAEEREAHYAAVSSRVGCQTISGLKTRVPSTVVPYGNALS